MKKILILYFSGVGNTKYVAECMYLRVKKQCIVDIKSIEEIAINFDISQYDKIVLGTSTIHSEPAKPMKEFLKDINRLEKPIPAFIYATYGLFPENVLRVLADLCIAKNIVPVSYSAYRCSATDGMLLVPSIKFFAKNEKYINKKIEKDINEFINEDKENYDKPKYKWYGILNYPNKWMGQHFHFQIFLHKKHCIRCNKCVVKCPMGAMKKDDMGYPIIDRQKCINCYRCIYFCPHMALSLFKKKRHKKSKLYCGAKKDCSCSASPISH